MIMLLFIEEFSQMIISDHTIIILTVIFKIDVTWT